jgi:hypothetical protein
MVGSVKDHVHASCLLSNKIALEKVATEAKKGSSKGVSLREADAQDLRWQCDKAAFSVCEACVSNLPQSLDNEQRQRRGKVVQEELQSIVENKRLRTETPHLWH